MWSSSGEDIISNTSTNSSFSKSSHSSSQSHSFSKSSHSSSQSPLQQNPRIKTMEEVWKDISLPPKPNNCQYHHQNSFRGTDLQDFLARPFNKDAPSSLGSGTSATEFFHFGPSPPPPLTSLCLNSGPEFHSFDNTSDPLGPHPQLSNNSNDVNSSFAFDASCSTFPSFFKKRGSESEDGTGDRRHKRMIKNRESAARSRARKQSYTNELENVVHFLKKENERLKKNQEELILAAAAAAALPKKATLHRTLTAPF